MRAKKLQHLRHNFYGWRKQAGLTSSARSAKISDLFLLARPGFVHLHRVAERAADSLGGLCREQGRALQAETKQIYVAAGDVGRGPQERH